MPEPDFEQIAQQLVINGWREQDARTAIADALRQVWNARGAADIAKVNGSLLTGNVPRVVDAIRSLDR